MSLHAYVAAHQNGFDENMFLESGSRTYVEETGGANFFFVTKGGELVIPKSGSILPSITRRSMVYVAENYLGLNVTQRPVALAELPDFVECGLCGTAAVISPVGKVVDHGKEICSPSGVEKMGDVTKRLYDTMTGIQLGTVEAPEGWIRRILSKEIEFIDLICVFWNKQSHFFCLCLTFCLTGDNWQPYKAK